ncbi:putative ABC-type transport system involved in multi-copper enzyme maturation, permease component [Desulfovibrionales bacterium]
MNQCLLLARKDCLILFRSPLAYILLTCLTSIVGYFFAASLQYYELISVQLTQNPDAIGISPMELIVAPYLQNTGVILLFFLPLLTMRSFSEEKRMGAFEMLMSYPITEVQLAGGKLLVQAIFLAVALALAAVPPLQLSFFTTIEILPFLVGFGGLFLIGLAFASLGLFLSSLTESQIVAAVLSFASLLLLWVLAWLKEAAPKGLGPILASLSIMQHFEQFPKGVIEAADLAYYLTFTVGFFWLTVLSLENQRWRG